MERYIGMKLNQRYELISILGVGGMAVVYKAKDLRLNRMVAVKVLKQDLAADADICSRFHDESRTVSMMNHPNIVNIFDVNQDDKLDYFVMELVDGITLKQYIRKRGGVLNWREALHFCVQIMLALEHAHSKGIIHRDIKPQNVMVLKDGSIKVADFGIARIMDSAQQTMTKEALGSVHYISPEQAKGSAVDARSDIYSAGVVLYEMTTGRLPYEGDSPVSVAVQHINSVPLPPRDLNADIPAGMEQINIRMMAPDRELRYLSAGDVLKDLEEFRRNPAIRFDYEFPWMAAALQEREQQGEQDGQDTVRIPWKPEELVNEPVSQPKEEEPAAEVDEEQEEKEERKRTALMIGAIVVGILIVLFIIFRMVFFGLFSNILDGGTEYVVPDLRGKTYTEAEGMIFKDEELYGHFTITISEETGYNAAYEPGQIISQEPYGGTTTKSEKTDIVVVICAEAEAETQELIMPSILNERYEDWADMLSDKYSVVVKYKAEFSDDVDEGLILKTDPVAGTVLQEGQTVTLTYSKGPKATNVTMISLIGYSVEEAKAALTDLGLTSGSVVTVESDKPAGTVVFQSIQTGSSVEKNTAVDLQISSGPRPKDEPTQPEEQTPTGPDAPGGNLPEDEAHTITVKMPANRTEASTVVIRVNGENYYSATVPAEQSTVTVEYRGTVEAVDATVDGMGTECVVK